MGADGGQLYDDGLETLFSVYPEGVDIEIEGLFGGEPGKGAFGGVRKADGTLVRNCGTGELVSLTGTDKVVEIELGGGSGYGDPAARDSKASDRDILNGYVSR